MERQRRAVHLRVLYCTVLHRTVLYCTILYYITVLYCLTCMATEGRIPGGKGGRTLSRATRPCSGSGIGLGE